MKIVLACGGTGGHIFPAISVAEEIEARRPDAQILYVCGQRDIEDEIFKLVKDRRVVPVESAPFRGLSSLCNAFFLIKLTRGFFASLSFLRKERPEVVVGFGGHTSFPMLVAARVLGVRALLHEQNVMPGRANRMLARWMDGVALSFDESAAYLKCRGRVRVTGNPIRVSIEKAGREEALRFFNFAASKKTLLVLGGSQGSESINTVFLKTLPALHGDFQVLHLCGKMSVEEAGTFYRSAGVAAKVYSFFDRMDMAYGAADLALGRAGATFLAEISAKGIPAILVPYPFAAAHQLLNARKFAERHAAIVIEQQDLTPERLSDAIARGFELPRRQPAAADGADARRLLADFILEKNG